MLNTNEANMDATMDMEGFLNTILDTNSTNEENPENILEVKSNLSILERPQTNKQRMILP
jgi:hypothetical protein